MTIKYNNELKMFVGFDGKRNYYGAKAWQVIVQAYSIKSSTLQLKKGTDKATAIYNTRLILG